MAEEQQLPYDSIVITKLRDYWMPRGDTRELTFEHTLGPSSAVKTAQIELSTTSGTTVMSATLADDAAQWDFTTSDQGIFTFVATDTATVDAGAYDYAIQLTDQSDRVFTVLSGTFTLRKDIVDNDASSPYPDWDTLADLQTDISQMATCGNLSWLTTAIAGGEGTIYVENGAIFSASDDIRVVLDNGTYEDDVIDSILNNTITLTGTISGVAAVGNVVRIL